MATDPSIPLDPLDDRARRGKRHLNPPVGIVVGHGRHAHERAAVLERLGEGVLAVAEGVGLVLGEVVGPVRVLLQRHERALRVIRHPPEHLPPRLLVVVVAGRLEERPLARQRVGRFVVDREPDGRATTAAMRKRGAAIGGNGRKNFRRLVSTRKREPARVVLTETLHGPLGTVQEPADRGGAVHRVRAGHARGEELGPARGAHVIAAVPRARHMQEHRVERDRRPLADSLVGGEVGEHLHGHEIDAKIRRRAVL